MTQEQINELRKLAQAANDLDPGEWTAGNNQWVGCVLTKATLLGRDISLCVADCTTLEAAAMQNAAYIAAANPAAILAMIAEIDRTKRMFAESVSALAAIDAAMAMPEDGCNSTDKTITAIKLLHAVRDDDEKEIARITKQRDELLAEMRVIEDILNRETNTQDMGYEVFRRTNFIRRAIATTERKS